MFDGGELFLNDKVQLFNGDSREVLKRLPDNSIDSVVTDPPYALVSIVKRFGGENAKPVNNAGTKAGNKNDPYARAAAGFMGQKWDTGETAFAVEFWAEVMRVLKPGGHVVAASGTRTYHRLAVAIEDAGFEIRDCIMWLYGAGFPKSHSVSKAYESSFEISKLIDILQSGGMMDSCLNHANIARTQFPKSQTEAGRLISRSDFVGDPALLPIFPEKLKFDVITAELQKCGVHLTLTPVTISVAENVDQHSSVSKSHASSAGKLPESTEATPSQDSFALSIAPGWGVEQAEVQIRVDEVLKIWLGNRRSCVTAIMNALSVELIAGWKRTILNRSETFRNLDTMSQTAFVSATTAIITESTAERLISNTVDILERKKRECEGLGTALKPACEPWVFARKPLIGTVAANVLAHGCGALNIDGCRVGDEGGTKAGERAHKENGNVARWEDGNKGARNTIETIDAGRWPANVIHDGCLSEEWGRYFYSAKADKIDRAGSKHPTVKPVDLMQYLCRLVTPPNGIVLDPFAGSGSTGEAAWREGFRCVLIEREEEYAQDIRDRLNMANKGPNEKKREIAKKKGGNESIGGLFS